MSIAATLDLDMAAKRTWDAIVVGAGPAGALAARQLASRGLAILLVDRVTFPRGKVCGCCFNPWALATLADAGLGGLTDRLGAVPLASFRLASHGRHAVLPLSGRVSMSREAFDASLVEASLAAGASFLPGTTAVLGAVGPSTRTVRLRRDAQIVMASARLILAADGLGGRLLAGEVRSIPFRNIPSHIGAGATTGDGPSFYQRKTIFMACGAWGYLGMVRLEDDRLDLAMAIAPEQVRDQGGLGAAAAQLLAEAGFPAVPAIEDLAWRGTPRLTGRLARPASERVFVLGDAAGYVEPFTGEGIGWALATAKAVVPLALRAVRSWQPELIREWSGVYRRTIANRQLACHAMAWFLRHSWLVAGLVRTLSWMPALALPVVRHLQSIPSQQKAASQ